MLTENRFLLVSLNIDAVLEEPTIYKRKKKLDEMTQGNGLRDAYSATLDRIRAQKGSRPSLGMDMLMWLSHSERPLTTNELCDALGVEIGSVNRNSEDIPTIETLLGCSLGLVVVEEYTYTVRLVHRTLQEYLRDNTDLFHSPHATIAEVCLTYLNFQCIRALPPIPYRPQLETSLLEYASCCWGVHARREVTESVNRLAMRLLDGFDEHVSSGIFLSHNHVYWDRCHWRSNPKGFTGLHCVAYLGMVEAAFGLLGMRKWDLGATDVGGNTAISWAVKQGHKDMVEMLLEQEGVSPNTADRDGVTPLHRAVRDGRVDIVKMLLGREDLALGTMAKNGQTPLLRAIIDKRASIVEILLKRKDIIPDAVDEDGWTPLSWAAIKGHSAIVKMLLGRGDITPCTADNDGRTPLSWAAGNGHGDIVEMLLEREDVTPDIADKDGRTPLSWAAGRGHKGVVQILLELEDATPESADKNGRTPLAWAAAYGNDDVVRALLERGDIAAHATDTSGCSPLLWAARYGHGGVVRILLGRKGVIPDTADEGGRTPLSWAALYGHGGIVSIFLKREDVTPDAADKYGRTPLSWAARSGNEDIVKQLLKRGGVTPDTPHKNGQTPLSWAKERGHTRVVEMLLERCSVGRGLMTTDSAGQTALTQTPGKKPERVMNRRFGYQSSFPQGAGSNSSVYLAPAKPSEPSLHPSKRIRRF